MNILKNNRNTILVILITLIFTITINKVSSGVNRVTMETTEDVKKVTTVIATHKNDMAPQMNLEKEKVAPVELKEVKVVKKQPAVLGVTYISSPSTGCISSNFGERNGRMHKGIDIAANQGTTIKAALNGTVNYAGWQDGYGYVIRIDHNDNVETIYAHCSAITVKKGEDISKGTKIGEVGSTGNSTGPHLHFEVRENGEAKNPEGYIK